MKLPCEITAQWILPQIRISIAKYMSNKGFNQKYISEYLNVSQPVISGYLKDDKKLKGELLPLQSIIDEMRIKITEQLERNSEITSVELLPNICSICKNSRISGPMCTYHRNIQNGLPQVCSICITTESGLVAHEQKIKLQQRLIVSAKEIYNSEEIYNYIPEIGSQFAALYSTSNNDTNTEMDVLTFPGRIIKYKDSVKIVSIAEYGMSTFTAKLLLNFYQLNPKVKCVLILKNTEKLYQKIRQSNNFIVKDTEAVDRGWKTLFENMKQFNSNVICDTGDVGYESLSYFFSDSPEKMVEIISSLIH